MEVNAPIGGGVDAVNGIEHGRTHSGRYVFLHLTSLSPVKLWLLNTCVTSRMYSLISTEDYSNILLS